MHTVFNNSRTRPKRVTGSNKIWAEHKGKMPYTAKSTAVHVHVCNRPPKFDRRVKDDSAYWERWVIESFDKTRFETNPKKADEIFTEEFMSGLLNLVLEMVLDYLFDNKLQINQQWEEVREEWLKAGDPIYKFITENMDRNSKNDKPTAVIKDQFLKCVQKWYDSTYFDTKGRPNSVDDLTETIKICGGSLDSRRDFEVDEVGANHRKTGNKIKKEIRVYELPWTWKFESVYGRMVSKPTTDSE